MRRGNPGIAGLNSVEVNSTYYAEILPSGELGAWMQTTPYPTTIEDQACVVYDNYLYCIGGWKSVTYGFTANDYYASLSSSGIVNWTATTAYPFMTSDHKTCGISNNNIVCAGGYINGGQSVTYSAFYAPIGYGGLGQWEQLPAYPSGAWRSMSAISTGSSVCYVGGYNDALGYTTNGVYCIQVG